MNWMKVKVDDPNLKFFGLEAIEECVDYNLEDIRKSVKRKKTKVKEKIAKKPKIEPEIVSFAPSTSGSTLEPLESQELDFEGYEEWRKFALQDSLLRAIKINDFKEPTKIQSLTLPAAILGHRDILGAAETGSGKTLAFGLPILSGILSAKEKSASNDKPLYALILTPTRELAIQVKNHLVAVAKFTDINVAVVVGGMAAVKQERILGKCPEIVVATPGRLWELFQEGNPHLAKIDKISYLAIDETDRMLEKGHFEELHNLLERLNMDSTNTSKRQNFVFSATLTLVHDLPKYLTNKTKIKKLTTEQKLQKIISTLGIKNPKIVDITQDGNTVPQTLTESRISCAFEEKDYYIYYFLQKHPGRTLVFCNSIGCVKRLANLLAILECKPLPLHASMQQRQRLKNLEKFKENDKGILIATDVAARGLDIPNVEHVLHYQIPRTSESYIHRSGRTARATKEGLTLVLMEPSEIKTYVKLCQTLNKSEDLPLFPVQDNYLKAVKERVSLAREIDKLELDVRKGNSEEGWLQKAAKDMDMIVDDFIKTYDNKEINEKKKPLSIKRKCLSKLLGKPIFPIGFSGKYINGINQFTSTVDPNNLITNGIKKRQIPLFKPKKTKN